MKQIRRNIYKSILMATLFAAALISSARSAHAALSIEYTIFNTQTENVSVYYDPLGDNTLHGTNLSVAGVKGNDTTLHSNETLPITAGNLTFQTGALTSHTGNTYYFATPGSFTITGGIPALGLTNATSLVVGRFTSASVTYFPLYGNYQFDIVGAGLQDSDNKQIYSYFGIPAGSTFSNAFTLAFVASARNGGFTSTNITGGTLIGSPVPTPIPAAFWLMGSGLLGVMGIKRKKR